MLYSNMIKPVALPPGRAMLSTKPAPTGSTTTTNTIGYGAGHLQSRPLVAAPRQNDIRRERGQFHRVFANVVRIARPKAIVDLHVATVAPAQLLQRLRESREASLHVCIVGVHAAP